MWRQINGLEALIKLLSLDFINSTLIQLILKVLTLCCRQPTNVTFLLMSNKLVPLVNLLDHSVFSKEPYVPSLCSILTQCINQPNENEDQLKMKTGLIRYSKSNHVCVKCFFSLVTL